MNNAKVRPQVGVGIFVFNSTEDKILIGKRVKEQKYALPGGRLDFGETFEFCSLRELLEETCISIKGEQNFKVMCCYNCMNLDIDFHWIQVFTRTIISESEEKMLDNPEKDKCESWIWVTYDELLKLKSEFFFPLQNFLDKYKITSYKDILQVNNYI